jgi:hypothetical protein
MIWLYSGTPGSGKSYHCAKDVYSRLKSGKRVIANTVYNLGLIKESNREKFTYKDNSELTVKFLEDYSKENHVTGVEGQTLLVIDECSVMFNSRDYARKDRMEWITLLQQHRKLGYNIILIAQSDRMIDRQIRNFIEYDVKHRSVKNFKIFGVILSLFAGGNLFAAVTYWYGMREKIEAEFIPYSKRIAKFYNTFEIFDEEKKKDVQPDAALGMSVSKGSPMPRQVGQKKIRKPMSKTKRLIKKIMSA